MTTRRNLEVLKNTTKRSVYKWWDIASKLIAEAKKR